MPDLFDLTGRIAVVTGGSKGIGRMIADGLVRRGVRVYITARHADVCLQTAEELSEFGECIAIPNDLGSLDGVHELGAELKQRESKLDRTLNRAQPQCLDCRPGGIHGFPRRRLPGARQPDAGRRRRLRAGTMTMPAFRY